MAVERFVALLRGVNVGGQKPVPMAGLRALAGELGWSGVESYIQSGNLAFAAAGPAPALGQRLERAIEERFGFPVPVVVRTAAAWAALVSANPFREESGREPGRVLLVLSKAPPRAEAPGELESRATLGERVRVAGGGLWVHYAGGVGRSKLTPALLDRAAGSPATARNWSTVLALAALVRRGA